MKIITIVSNKKSYVIIIFRKLFSNIKLFKHLFSDCYNIVEAAALTKFDGLFHIVTIGGFSLAHVIQLFMHKGLFMHLLSG